MELYLITGFLGAGKSTFLKNFIRLFSDKRIYMIINEFGREGVDGRLFSDIDAQLAEISNGSIFCSCRLDKFEEVLTDAGRQNPDVILVEASGLADPTGISRVISGYPEISYHGSICLCDALRLHTVLPSARSAAKQLAVSSLVLINKTDLADEGQISLAESHVRGINPASHIERTSFGQIEKEWLTYIRPLSPAEPEDTRPDLTLQKATVSVTESMTPSELVSFIHQFSEETYRVKGFVRLGEEVYLADCVGPSCRLEPWTGELPDKVGFLVVLSGRGMALRKSLNAAVKAYPGAIPSISYG